MMIDSHCHLHDPALADIGEMLRVSLSHDVWGVVRVGIDAAPNGGRFAAATAYPPGVWLCLAFRPDRLDLTDADVELVIAQLDDHHARPVAVGEVGLPWNSLEGHADPASVMTR